MQDKSSRIANYIERLKMYFGVKTARQVAERLGVSEQTISTWKSRGSIDYELIFSKCKDLDLNWFIRGEEDSQGKSTEQSIIKQQQLAHRVQNIATSFNNLSESLKPLLDEYTVDNKKQEKKAKGGKRK